MRTWALPTGYDEFWLGTDYGTLESFLADYGRHDFSDARGKVLVVPKGITHTETPSSALISNPINANNNAFLAIVGEDPTDKPLISIDASNLSNEVLRIQDYSRLIDVRLSFSIESNIPVIIQGNGCGIGLILESVISSLDSYASLLYGFQILGRDADQGFLLDSAIIGQNWIVPGDSYPIAVYCGGDDAYIYNTIATDILIGYVQFESSPSTLKNCLTENCTYPYLEQSNDVGIGLTANFDQTTCAWNEGLSIDTDGYTLLESDAGNGTDLSSDGIFAFPDDINGDTRVSGQWERGADAYTVAADDEEPTTSEKHVRRYVGRPANILNPSMAQTVNANLSKRIMR